MFATTEMFRAASSPSGRVDKLNRVIYGVAIVEKGPVRFDGRKQYADDETLQQVLDLGRRAAEGVKSHLSHGDDATDGIFNHLGRFRNFRIVGNATVADLYVAASAKDGDYILNLAAEDPQAFGASMLCSLDRKAPRRADGFQAIRVLELMAIDLVGTPALTGGLLADAFNAQDQQRATTLMSKPHETSAAASHLDAVAEYMQDPAGFMRDGRSLTEHVEEWFDNNRGSYEMSDAIYDAVEKQSKELRTRWEGGEIADPYERTTTKNGL